MDTDARQEFIDEVRDAKYKFAADTYKAILKVQELEKRLERIEKLLGNKKDVAL